MEPWDQEMVQACATSMTAHKYVRKPGTLITPPKGAISLSRGACSDGLVRTMRMLINIQHKMRKRQPIRSPGAEMRRS
jgi:uncharacterized protein YijF (DUF1287 family)